MVFYGPPVSGSWTDRLDVSDQFIDPLFRAVLDRAWTEAGGELVPRLASASAAVDPACQIASESVSLPAGGGVAERGRRSAEYDLKVATTGTRRAASASATACGP